MRKREKETKERQPKAEAKQRKGSERWKKPTRISQEKPRQFASVRDTRNPTPRRH